MRHEEKNRVRGTASGRRKVPRSILRATSDIIDVMALRRELESPEEAVTLALVTTTATLVELCGRFLAGYPVFDGLGTRTRLEALHFLFILYDVTAERTRAGDAAMPTQKQIGRIMRVLGWGNETSIPNALKNAFDEYLEGGAASQHLSLNPRGVRLVESIAGRYYALMEELFQPAKSDLARIARVLRDLRERAKEIDRGLGEPSARRGRFGVL